MQASDNNNNNHQYKNRIDYKAYNYLKKNYGSNDNNMKYLGKTISTISNDNYLSKYDLLKNCQENPTINSLLFQIDNNNEGNFDMSKIFDGLKDIVYYDYNNIHTINLKNILEPNIRIMKKNRWKRSSILLKKNIRNLSAYKVCSYLINAEIDKNQGKIIKRGDFKTLENNLE
jgi:hypothetical protein